MKIDIRLELDSNAVQLTPVNLLLQHSKDEKQFDFGVADSHFNWLSIDKLIGLAQLICNRVPFT